MFWNRKSKDIADELTDDLKKVTEVAGDQIAPGMGTLLLVVGGLAVAGAGAYIVHQRRKKKGASAQQVGRQPDCQR